MYNILDFLTTKCTWEYMNVRELIWQEGEKCIMVSFTVLLHVGSACCCVFHAFYKLGMWKLNYNIAEGIAISEYSLHLCQLSSLIFSIPCGHWWTVFCSTLQCTSWCPHRLSFQGSSRQKWMEWDQDDMAGTQLSWCMALCYHGGAALLKCLLWDKLDEGNHSDSVNF